MAPGHRETWHRQAHHPATPTPTAYLRRLLHVYNSERSSKCLCVGEESSCQERPETRMGVLWVLIKLTDAAAAWQRASAYLVSPLYGLPKLL